MKNKHWAVDESGSFIFSDTKFTTDTEYNNQLQRQREQYNSLEKSEPFFNVLIRFQTNVLMDSSYNLTRAEAGILLMLCTYVRHTNHISEKNYLKENGKFLNTKDLTEILQLTTRQVSDYKKKLINKGALYQDDFGLYIDKKIMTRGYTNSQQSYRVFIHPVRELYQTFIVPNKPNSIKNLGLFFALIPFIYKQNNNIVQNEKDTNFEGVYINHDWDSLAEVLHTKKSDLKRDMKAMNDKYLIETDEHLIWTETYKLKTVSDLDKREVKAFRFVVNPNVTFSSTEENRLETLKIMEIEDTTKINKIREKETFIVGILLNNNKVYYFKSSTKYSKADLKKINRLKNQNKAIRFKQKDIICQDIMSISTFNNLAHLNKSYANVIEIQLSDEKKTFKDFIFI